MPKLPTVVLVHRTTGKQKIVNQTDYGRNIAAYKDWKIVSEQRGDATDAIVRQDSSFAKLEQFRRNNPEREAKFGDNQRIQDENAVTVSLETAEALTEQPAAPVKDWRNMKWPDARKYIKEVTGTVPASKKQAEELMA